jgi:hypothetical protein
MEQPPGGRKKTRFAQTFFRLFRPVSVPFRLRHRGVNGKGKAKAKIFLSLANR